MASSQGEPSLTEKLVRKILPPLIIIVVVAIEIFHWFDLLGSEWLRDHSPELLLLLFAMLAGYIGYELPKRMDSLDETVQSRADDTVQRVIDVGKRVELGSDRVIESLAGLRIQQFDTLRDIYQYWQSRLQQAKKSVDDLVWGHYTEHSNTSAEEAAFQDYLKTIPEVCKRGVRYREVMTFPHGARLERAEKVLASNIFEYHLKYYDLDDDFALPLMQFAIVDSEEVFVFFYRAPYLPTDGERRFAIKHPKIAGLFQDYFETIWHGAKPLKQGQTVDRNEMDKIRQKGADSPFSFRRAGKVDGQWIQATYKRSGDKWELFEGCVLVIESRGKPKRFFVNSSAVYRWHELKSAADFERVTRVGGFSGAGYPFEDHREGFYYSFAGDAKYKDETHEEERGIGYYRFFPIATPLTCDGAFMTKLGQYRVVYGERIAEEALSPEKLQLRLQAYLQRRPKTLIL